MRELLTLLASLLVASTGTAVANAETKTTVRVATADCAFEKMDGADRAILQHLIDWARQEYASDSLSFECAENALSMFIGPDKDQTSIYRPSLPLIAEQQRFFGLASFYNRTEPVALAKSGLVDIEENQQLTENVWSGWKGRYRFLLLWATSGHLHLENDAFSLNTSSATETELRILLATPALESGSPIELSQMRYSHLWDWLRVLCFGLEKLLIWLQYTTGVSWGTAIVLLAIVIKLALSPLSIFTVRAQRRVNEIQASLEDSLKAIKAEFDGEIAHKKIMAAHSELGVTPFYSLRPMIGNLIQIPLLIAVFNVLGEIPDLAGRRYLWVADLGYPDTIATMGLAVPFLGNGLNLLPFLMTAVTILSTLLHRNRYASSSQRVRQKRNLYFMAAAFFLLFYPFPASMVLYWTTANVLQFAQQQITRA